MRIRIRRTDNKAGEAQVGTRGVYMMAGDPPGARDRKRAHVVYTRDLSNLDGITYRGWPANNRLQRTALRAAAEPRR